MNGKKVQVSKCQFWQTCGASIVSDYQAKLLYPAGDPRRDRIGIICCNDEAHKECWYYSKRVELLQDSKN